MKLEDLQFWKRIEGGRKSHYIFKQDDLFYVFTDLDEGMRGNFICLSQTEIDKVREELSAKIVPKRFRCRSIYQYVKGMDIQLSQGKDETEKQNYINYYVDRLTRICYILEGQGFLVQVKDGNVTYFYKYPEVSSQTINLQKKRLKNSVLPSATQKINKKIDLTKNLILFPKYSGGKTTEKRICPYCNVSLNRNKFDKHTQQKCPKRPNLC